MSVEAMAQCWGEDFPVEATGLSKPIIRLVALAVADVVNDLHHNEFWGSRRLLAAKTGVNPDTVSDVMRHLVATGVVEELSRQAGQPVRYRWIGVAVNHRHPTGGSGEPPPPVAVSHRRGSGEPPLNTKEPNVDPNLSARPLVERGDFGEFWKLYPRRIGKRAAITAYERATRRADPAAILAGLDARVRWWTKARTTMDKIPYPATWLNRDSWADELEPTPATAAASQARAVADVEARVRDEFEDAVAAGDFPLAWAMLRAKARSSGRSWFDKVASALDRGTRVEIIPNVVKHAEDGTAVSEEEIAAVIDARAELLERCHGEPRPQRPVLEVGNPTEEDP